MVKQYDRRHAAHRSSVVGIEYIAGGGCCRSFLVMRRSWSSSGHDDGEQTSGGSLSRTTSGERRTSSGTKLALCCRMRCRDDDRLTPTAPAVVTYAAGRSASWRGRTRGPLPARLTALSLRSHYSWVTAAAPEEVAVTLASFSFTAAANTSAALVCVGINVWAMGTNEYR